ncbi:hypothetical protein HA402_000513 [Bradysia odoriphaga]|nr:hypothetical protein HA402_000513 [Bradysia odoriphaga]
MQADTNKTEIYTITSDQHVQSKGQDNLGHDIPELLPTSNGFIAVPLQTVFDQSHSIPQPPAIEMTPLPSGPRMGRKTSFFIDTLIVLIVALWLILIEVGIFPHVQRGFYCDDRSIAFKFTGDTISTALIISSIFVPFFLIWLNEAIFYKPESIKCTRLKRTLTEALFWFKQYSIGMVIHFIIIDGLKVLVGELRPHFLDTCQPDAFFNCSGSEFITEYTCTNTVDKQFFVRDSSKSFPSGHSSISFFEAIFMIWYLQRRMPRIRSQFLLLLLQVLLLFWACVCSVSRITDHRHHWWDVLAGSALGVFFAVMTCIFLCRDFKRKLRAQEVILNGNGDARHTSVRRLLSDNSVKDEVTMNHVVVT